MSRRSCNLAALYRDQGRFADAEPLYKRSLEIREKTLGPDHPDIAASLNTLANLYQSQSRYDDAAPLYKRALAIYLKAFGSNHRDVATTLGNLANLYLNQGRYADAEPLFKQSLAIKEKALGPNHSDVATALNNLASLYGKQGRYADAEPLFKQSLAIKEKALGPDHADVAKALSNLAMLYKDQGRLPDAERLIKRSLAIFEKALGPNHPDVAKALSNLGLLYEFQGRYADAEPLYERSLAIREKALDPDHADVAASLNNLGGTYTKQGRYADAEPLIKRSLAINEKVLGPDHPDVGQSLNDLATLYSIQGSLADAETLYKRSLAIREKALGPDHDHVATVLNDLAWLYRRQGRYADAEPLYKRSLALYEKVLGPNHHAVAVALNNLAELYEAQGRLADAEPLMKRSLAISEKVLGPDHPSVGATLANLAVLYRNQGRYADAEPLSKRSLTLYEKVLGPDHPDVAKALNNLALLYEDQGRLADAEALYKRSLAIREKTLGPDHAAVATTLHNLAGLYSHQGRYAGAEALYKRSLAITEKALGPTHPDVVSSLNSLAMLYETQGRYADALPLIQAASQTGFTDVHLAVLTGSVATSLISVVDALNESYRIVQQATSSAASNAINRLSVRFAAGTNELAQLVRRDQDLSDENERLDKILIDAVSKEPSKRDATNEQRLRDRLTSIATERAEIQTSLNERFPEFAALSKPTATTVKDTQALLADDEALVIFYFDRKSYVWIVTRTDADWLGVKVAAKELGEKVKALRLSLTFDVDKPFDVQLAFQIYSETFGAIADRLRGKRHLSVVTNGALTSLPLQLLVTKDPSGKSLKDVDWLVRSYAIANLPSVASLKTLRSAASSSSAVKPMIAFADPIFSKEEKTQVAALRSVVNFYDGGKPDLISLAKALPQLPDTANEVLAIAEALKADETDLKLGISASETTVKQMKLDDYRIVYFATHGLVAGEVEKFAKVKAEPALALTLPEMPTDLDDGLLTASEVAQLKLNADWAVLSACNTAAEGNPGAEALSGLARAFFYAGARSLVVSHWEVDSDSTVRLMIGTFEAAARDPKLSHAEALRESMLTMIDNAKSDDDAHPRFWAPFVVVGEPAKVQ
jgi:CHAT domain-containing protein/tetratricopeptide (TPR) repeat protein